jgi:hypothetical protein
MPPVIRRAPLSQGDDLVRVPRRVAFALRPSENREDIPVHVDLSTNAPPYSGELREQQTRTLPQNTVLDINQTITMCGLRRAWNFVGFLIHPGTNDAGGGGLVANLVILTRGLDGMLPDITVLANRTQAFTGLIVGARCELRLTNLTFNPIFGLKASIWGMGEK